MMNLLKLVILEKEDLKNNLLNPFTKKWDSFIYVFKNSFALKNK